MNYGGAETRTKEGGGNGPIDTSAPDLARRAWLTAGQGFEILADAEITLFDWTGVVGAAKDLQEGNYAGLGLSVVVRAGGPALSRFFKVAEASLVSGRLLTGTNESVQIAAQFSKSGKTLIADIVYAGNQGRVGLSKTSVLVDVYRNVLALAEQTGAKEVTVNAVAVVNAKLEARLIKDGWRKTKVWIEHFGEVEAYTKTYRLPKK